MDDARELRDRPLAGLLGLGRREVLRPRVCREPLDPEPPDSEPVDRRLDAERLALRDVRPRLVPPSPPSESC
ncbi:MAG: hypothetical protein JOY56_05550 [Solirubrobacterales bacterium]|nr:hypothetical protein [Solirubrobacterales bacterium]